MKTHGNGRVFCSTLGHLPESWGNAVVQRLYFEAIRWSLRLTDGDASPRAR